MRKLYLIFYYNVDRISPTIIDNPKSIGEIAETLGIDKESVGLVINALIRRNALKVTDHASSDGFKYYC